MNLDGLYNTQNSELVILEEILNLIQSYEKEKNTCSKIKKLISSFINAVDFIINQLEQARKRLFISEKNVIVKLEKLVNKNKLFDEDISNKISIIKKKIDSTILEDRRVIDAPPRSISVNQNVTLPFVNHEIEQLIQLKHSAQDIFESIQSQVDAFAKDLKRLLPRKAKEMRNQIKSSLIGLLDNYENEFNNVFQVNIHLNTLEIKLISDLLLVKEALLKLIPYCNIDDEISNIKKLIERIKKIEKKILKRGVRYEQYLSNLDKKIKLKIESKSLSESLLRDPELDAHDFDMLDPHDSQVVVHATDYFPKKGAIFPTIVYTHKKDKTLQFPRNTIHFTINHFVKPVQGGLQTHSWIEKKYAILIPMSQFPKNKIESFHLTDTYIFGSIKIPSGSIIIAKEKDLVNDGMIPGNSKRSVFSSKEDLISFFSNRNIAVQLIGEDINLQKYVDDLIQKMGRILADNIESSKHHFSSWGEKGIEGAFKEIHIYINFFGNPRFYHKEEFIKGILKPKAMIESNYEDIEYSIYPMFIESFIVFFKFVNQFDNLDSKDAKFRDKRKVFNVFFDKCSKLFEYLEDILVYQEGAVAQSDLYQYAKFNELGEHGAAIIGVDILNFMEILENLFSKSEKIYIASINRLEKFKMEKGAKRIFITTFNKMFNTYEKYSFNVVDKYQVLFPTWNYRKELFIGEFTDYYRRLIEVLNEV